MRYSGSDEQFISRAYPSRSEVVGLALRATLKSVMRGKPKRYFSLPLSITKPSITAKWAGSVLKRKLLGVRTLDLLRVSVTRACQCNCWHCYERPMGCWKEGERKELGCEEIVGIMGQASRLGATQFSFGGGEPLLKPGLLGVIRAGSAMGFTTIFTNGLLLAEMAQDLKRAGLYRVRVSIDAPRAVVHDGYRRKNGCFSKAVEGLRRASEEGIVTSISTYVTKESLRNGEFRRMLELGTEIGVDTMYVFPIISSGRLENFKDMLTLEECEEASRIMREHNMDAPPVAYFERGLHAGGYCIGRNSVYVGCFGDVMPCGFVPVSYGNVRGEPLGTIWERLHADKGLRHKSTPCPLYHKDFRKRYIDSRPKDAPIPTPVRMLVRK